MEVQIRDPDNNYFDTLIENNNISDASLNDINTDDDIMKLVLNESKMEFEENEILYQLQCINDIERQDKYEKIIKELQPVFQRLKYIDESNNYKLLIEMHIKNERIMNMEEKNKIKSILKRDNLILLINKYIL